jgi:hypothetical protein
VKLLVGWATAQAVPDLAIDVLQPAGRTPLVFMELPASDPTHNEYVTTS